MLIYRPLQTKGFIKEFTDTLLTMAMKYPDLSSWEISTHTSTRLQIWSPTNSPPGFPPKHSLGISTLTFTVSPKGSLLLALSGMCHPDRKFLSCMLTEVPYLWAVPGRGQKPGPQGVVVLNSSAQCLQTCWGEDDRMRETMKDGAELQQISWLLLYLGVTVWMFIWYKHNDDLKVTPHCQCWSSSLI